MGDYYNFEKTSNSHGFLAEELTVPRMNSCDAQRGNMYSNHLQQLVHLVKPEFPRVFTNFENKISEYSIAYKKIPEDCEIIAKIWKNIYNYELIVRYKSTGVYDVIHFKNSVNITESYGYKLNDCLEDFNEGDTLKSGQYAYKSDNYDDEGNFSYGVNLKALFIPYKNLTYEDGVVITKSAAKKMASYKVEKIIVSINTNDVMLNLYGEENLYKSFPHVGDNSNDNILTASRREESQSMLYNFQYDKLRKTDQNDQIIYTDGGIITDIDIYSNTSIENIRKRNNDFSKEVADLLEEQTAYYTELCEVLEEIIPAMTVESARKYLSPTEFKQFEDDRKSGYTYKRPLPKKANPNQYTDELGYLWKVAHEYIDKNIYWRSDKKKFDNFKIKFTVLKENPLYPGCKITGRYGNKGIVSMIIDDEDAPITEDGIRADILLNPLGVLNRLNPAQMQEQYINFIADHVLNRIKSTNDILEKEDIFFDYLKYVNKSQHDYFENMYLVMNRKDKEEFFKTIENEGIFTHQFPFKMNGMVDYDGSIVKDGNASMEDFTELYKKHPEWVEKYNFVGIEKPAVMGDIYFIRLKHEPGNKNSAVASCICDSKNRPSKSSLKKDNKQLMTKNALRVGEMETAYLKLARHPEVLTKLLRSYSTSKFDRETLISELLTSEDPFNINVELSDEKSINRQYLDKLLSILEIGIDDGI